MSLRVIWRYDCTAAHAPGSDGTFGLDLPVGAQVLHVALQHGFPTLWALVNPKGVTSRRRFRIIETGDPFDTHGLVYRGTYQAPPAVHHLFEAVPDADTGDRRQEGD